MIVIIARNPKNHAVCHSQTDRHDHYNHRHVDPGPMDGAGPDVPPVHAASETHDDHPDTQTVVTADDPVDHPIPPLHERHGAHQTPICGAGNYGHQSVLSGGRRDHHLLAGLLNGGYHHCGAIDSHEVPFDLA